MKNHVLAAVTVAGIAVAGFTGLTVAQELTSSSSTALASAESGTGAPDFAAADTDKDGKLSYAEALAAYGTLGQQQFDQADTNKDDYLDATEYASLGAPQSVVQEGDIDHASSNGNDGGNGGNGNGNGSSGGDNNNSGQSGNGAANGDGNGNNSGDSNGVGGNGNADNSGGNSDNGTSSN